MSSPSPDDTPLAVEVVCALPERQWCIPLRLEAAATVADAIAASGLAEEPGAPDPACCAAGVWGEVAERERRLRDGDRVELYRPLVIDPREARRRAAEAGRTLGRSGPGESGSGGG
ncbi:MAG TPA: RnfH family protein [Woeseiaceae bacterium]|nr:RnfH family protein [Woeseiaceae bacterium]